MKKDDMIKEILIDSNFSKKELKKMGMSEIEQLYDEIHFEEINEDFTEGLEFGEDYVEDPTIDRELLEKHGINAEELMIVTLEQELEKATEDIDTEDGYIDGTTEAERLGEYIEEPETEEVVEIDFSKLSVVEQRQYRRTGILPQITINRYTRFDEETPKMGN